MRAARCSRPAEPRACQRCAERHARRRALHSVARGPVDQRLDRRPRRGRLGMVGDGHQHVALAAGRHARSRRRRPHRAGCRFSGARGPAPLPRARRSVPSMPATGSEDTSSGIRGEAQADLQQPRQLLRGDALVARQARAVAEHRRVVARRCARATTGASLRASLPACRLPCCCRLSVRNSCCAITLLLNLLMSRTISASGGDCASKAGARPGRHPAVAHLAGQRCRPSAATGPPPRARA